MKRGVVAASVRSRRRLSDQLRPVVPVVVALVLLTLVGSVLVVVAAPVTWNSIGDFTRDPITVGNLPLLAGLLSNLGALLWYAAAAICAFTAVLLKAAGRTGEVPSFLLASSALSALLLFDDFFLLHEALLRRYLGVPEGAVLGSLALILLGYLVGYGALLLRSDYLLLGCALVSFAASTAVDLLLDLRVLASGEVMYLVEDAPKFLGIALWFAYFARFSFRACTDRSS